MGETVEDQGVTFGPGHSGSAPSPVPGLGHPASVPNAVEEMQQLIKLCECGSEGGQRHILADVANLIATNSRPYELLHAGAFIDAAAAMLPQPAIWRRYTDESCSVYAASPYGGPAQVRHDGSNRVASLALAAAILRMRLAPLLKAQAIEARRAATGTGAVEDESAVGNADAPKVSQP